MSIMAAPPIDLPTSPGTPPRTGPEIMRGVKLSLPMSLGYLPIGFTFGAVALSAGMPAPLACCMSILVYAPSLQLLAIGLLLSRAPIGSLVATGLICNARHVLMSAALAPYLRHFNQLERMLFGWQLGDEAFALQSAQFVQGKPPRARTFAINMSIHAAFVVGTCAAALLQASPEHLRRFGLDYAPYAMLIAMAALLLKGPLQIVATLGAGILAAFLAHTALRTWSIVGATVVAATLGTIVELWLDKRGEPSTRNKSSAPFSA